MKENDLRIGNWVNINNTPHQIYRIDYKEVNLIKMGYLAICGIEKLQPIELTEELLMKIGFEKIEIIEKQLYMYYKKVSIDNCDYLLDFRVMPKDECIVLYVMKKEDADVDYSTIFYNDNIKYLHQLQNAYYCLTGQELEVEL